MSGSGMWQDGAGDGRHGDGDKPYRDEGDRPGCEGDRYHQARRLVDSLTYAGEGFAYALRTQRNMRIHFLVAVLVLILASALDLKLVELAILVITSGSVLVAELFNTAIEAAVDVASPRYHPLARIAKNVGAGAVLTTAISAVLVGYLLLFDRLVNLHPEALDRVVHTQPYVTLLAVGLVLLLSIALKALSGHARVQGGMPSAHTAIAFSLATAVFFVSNSGAPVILAGILAVLVGQSRLEAGIHSFLEVLVGGLLGVTVTILAFQLLFR